MYENVKKPKIKSNRTLWIVLIPTVIVMLIVVLIFLWPFEYLDNFQEFVADLSGSTVASYDSPTGLWADTAEGRVRIIGSNIHLTYFILANAGVGRICEPPAEPPMAVLTYADGARMELWNVKVESIDSNRTIGLCVSYTNPEGECYTYSHDHLDMSRLPLSEYANLPQKMKDKLKEEQQEAEETETAPVT